MNKRLAIVAPSGRLPEPTEADRAARFFAARGWTVQAGESVFAQDTRFAGDDALRVADLMAYACDPDTDVVLAARGGYGLTRLLERIDFASIARRAPILVGYSDFTAFNLAYLATEGGVSYQGPSAVDFARELPNEFTTSQFFSVLESDEHVLGFASEAAPVTTQGILWGGNLAMVCALLATPWFPRIEGGILFLEDVNEPAYKVERMLLQLAQAGVLDRQSAIVLGAFSPMPAMASDYGFAFEDALARVMAQTATPIVCGLPFGHVPGKAMLAVGAEAQLEVKQGVARLSYRGHPRL